MELLYMIIKSLYKQKKRITLMVIQLFFGFISLLIGFHVLGDVLNHHFAVKKLVPLDTIQVSSISFNSAPDHELSKEVYSELQKHGAVANIGTFVTDEISNLHDQSENSKTIEEDNEKIKLLFVDDGMLEMTKLSLAEGSLSSIKNYHKQDEDSLVPVIVGSELAKDNPIGSIREIHYLWDANNPSQSIKLKIVGILEKDTYFFEGDRIPISERLVKEKMVIIPMFEDMEGRFNSNVLITLKEGSDLEKFMGVIENKFMEKGLTAQVSTIQEQLDAYYQSNQVILWSSIIFSLIILLLTSFGITGVVLSSILQRKKEFGIRISVGATPKLIALMIVGEIILVFIISCMISILFLSLILVYFEFLPLSINMFNVVPTLFVSLSFALLSSIIPFLKINKMEPANLIKNGGGY